MHKGFTIIECLVSILLLVIIMTGGMSFYFYSTGLSVASTNKKIATDVANAELENIRNIGYAGVTPDPAPSACILWYTKPASGLIIGHQEVYVCRDESSDPDYKKIVVKVYWNEAGKKDSAEAYVMRDVTLATLISRP